MSKQSAAQREYVRDIRVQNSILYQASATKPKCFQNIDIIMKTVEYNELDDKPDSAEAKKNKAINTGLLIFTVLFELMVLSFRVLGFVFTLGKRRRKA